MVARKTAVFLAEESKISSLAINRLLFLADGPGYLLYLHDLGVILSDGEGSVNGKYKLTQ